MFLLTLSFFSISKNKMEKKKSKKIAVGKIRFCFAMIILSIGNINLNKTISHKAMKAIINPLNHRKIFLKFFFSTSSSKNSNPKPDKTAKEKLNNTIILLAALVDRTGMCVAINKSKTGVWNAKKRAKTVDKT